MEIMWLGYERKMKWHGILSSTWQHFVACFILYYHHRRPYAMELHQFLLVSCGGHSTLPHDFWFYYTALSSPQEKITLTFT